MRLIPVLIVLLLMGCGSISQEESKKIVSKTIFVTAWGDNPKWPEVDCGEDREAIVIRQKRRKDTSWVRIYDCRKKGA